MKTKKLNDDLLDLEGVCNYFGLSESTVRRKIRDTREGRGNFILPLFGSKCRIVFRRSDVANWKGEEAETILFDPSQIPSMPQAPPIPSSAQVRAGLARHGIILPPVTGNNPNN